MLVQIPFPEFLQDPRFRFEKFRLIFWGGRESIGPLFILKLNYVMHYATKLLFIDWRAIKKEYSYFYNSQGKNFIPGRGKIIKSISLNKLNQKLRKSWISRAIWAQSPSLYFCISQDSILSKGRVWRPIAHSSVKLCLAIKQFMVMNCLIVTKTVKKWLFITINLYKMEFLSRF